MNEKKLNNIEFLRIIGCIAIVFLHMFNHIGLLEHSINVSLFQKLNTMTHNAQKAVDMFFILSGFFFAYKLNPNKSLYDFIKQKVARLYPVLICIVIISLLFSPFVKWNIFDHLFVLLGLTGTGLIKTFGHTSLEQFWYVSTMLWISVMFFYLRKNYEIKNSNFIIDLLIIFSYSFLIHAKNGRISNHTQTFYYIFNVSMLRGFGGMGIGYFIGEWYKKNEKKIENIIYSDKQKIFISIIEFICLSFIIRNLIFHKLNYHNDLLYIIIFTITIITFLIKKGIFSKMLDNIICTNISKYTYSIYMVHILIIKILKEVFWKYYTNFLYKFPILNITIALVLIFLSGICIYYFIEQPSKKYVNKLVQRI